jgi:hypothetical protein
MRKYLMLVLALVMMVLIWPSHVETITATKKNAVITITTLDADWAWTDTFTSGVEYSAGIKIISIQFNPSATDDICVIEEASDAGPCLFYVKCLDTYDQRIKYYRGARLKPVFDLSDSTITTAANASIQITYEK